MVGGQTRSKGLPTDPRTQTAGGRDMVPPGGWGLVDNKRNTHVVLEIRISTNCDCGQKNVKRQFFAIFESGNSNIHSNPDSNIMFFAIFESGKIVFRNSITLPVSYEYIPTAKMIVNI